MEDIIRWLGPCFGFVMVVYWMSRYFWERSEGEMPTSQNSEVKVVDKEPKTNKYDVLNTCQLLERVLKNIGCHIDMCKDEKDTFYVTYQGEHFTIIYSETSPFINIYDVAWYSAELDDIDNLSLVRQAVNACNRENLSTVLYTIDKENNCVNVHTRQSVLFGSYIPDIEGYLRSRFEDSFRQHHNFYRFMEEKRKEQYV